MGWSRTASGVWRSVAFTLAAVALVLKIGLPPGVMPGNSHSPVPLVICTGHGPLVIGGHGHQPSTPDKARSDGTCAFAGSAAPATAAPDTVVAVRVSIVGRPLAGLDGLDLAPGRGLAAPPPPSHAPPERPTLT